MIRPNFLPHLFGHIESQTVRIALTACLPVRTRTRLLEIGLNFVNPVVGFQGYLGCVLDRNGAQDQYGTVEKTEVIIEDLDESTEVTFPIGTTQ